ncbi:DUF4262 domain-containing protein [Sphingobium scionense]|uniref:DUF4262 domain-containing protein n=2 Tax=Sphingobium TaxID=165695 RepID=T0IHA1_9SPHN|nr:MULTISPECIES: DUF4262 domain-containing protein [Sphingobium]EQB11080.1 hypothetical protein RLDS_24620 [Sphingobium lactosutens DS20]MBB4151168.1 hypothetical protein [Sphingobium scionense]
MIIPTTGRAIIQSNIDRTGQHIFAIFPDADNAGFAYTIGNARPGLPELLIIGNFAPILMASVLNEVGQRMRQTDHVPDKDIDIGGAFPIRPRLAGAEARTAFTIQVGRFLGHDEYAVVQLLLPDPMGFYPGEPGCDPRYDVPRP